MTVTATSLRRYDAWAVRVVPDVARGEFVNVGLLVGGSADNEWAVRMTKSLTRASRIAENLPEKGVRSVLKEVQSLAEIAGGQAHGALMASMSRETALGHLHRRITRSYNLIQFSPVMPSVGESAEDVLEQLYPVLVEADEPQKRPNIRKVLRSGLLSALKDPLRLRGASSLATPWLVVGDLRSHLDVATLRTDGLVGGLASVVSLAHSDADQLRNRIMAEAHVWQQARDSASAIHEDKHHDHTFALSPATTLCVMHTKPENAEQRKTLGILRQSWESANVDVVDSEATDMVVSELLAATP
ncbi:MAG: DUF3037 domain-containing protein [Galactobacter sp.]